MCLILFHLFTKIPGVDLISVRFSVADLYTQSYVQIDGTVSLGFHVTLSSN